jgi:hypothetical protein
LLPGLKITVVHKQGNQNRANANRVVIRMYTPL